MGDPESPSLYYVSAKTTKVPKLAISYLVGWIVQWHHLLIQISKMFLEQGCIRLCDENATQQYLCTNLQHPWLNNIAKYNHQQRSPDMKKIVSKRTFFQTVSLTLDDQSHLPKTRYSSRFLQAHWSNKSAPVTPTQYQNTQRYLPENKIIQSCIHKAQNYSLNHTKQCMIFPGLML